MNATTDAQSMALEMFKGEVPCIMSLTGECDAKAEYLVGIDHLGVDCARLEPNPAPFCEGHKSMIVSGYSPFWRTYMNAPPTLCTECGVELGLGKVEKL